MTRDELKIAIGIDKANCHTCTYLGSDSPGSDDPCEPSWPVCEKVDRYSNLKSFPFQKEMKCWYPDFWHTKFPERIKTMEDDEMDALSQEFYNIVAEWARYAKEVRK